jgi:hypothetical protein
MTLERIKRRSMLLVRGSEEEEEKKLIIQDMQCLNKETRSLYT